MLKKRHTTQHIVKKHRQANVELSNRQSAAAVFKLLGVTRQAYDCCAAMRSASSSNARR